MTAVSVVSQAQAVINVWPNGEPNDNGDKDDKAELTIFLPDKKKATGRAIVMCPGGGYSHLAMQHEGTDWAPYFNQQGIAVFVLKYRMPHGNCAVPISDAEEAIKMVRRNAKSMKNFLGEKPKKKALHDYSNERQVTRATPQAFIALSDDDTTVPPINGVNYYLECYRHDVPASLHVYPTGGHGWGYRASFDFHFEMLHELKGWLESL